MRERLPASMCALVLQEPDVFSVQTVPVPTPGPMEVVCAVDTCFICGTDPHIIHGEYPGFWPKEFPLIAGHEWAGIIVGLGSGTDTFGWRIGDRVAGTSHAGCGYCRMCRSGRYNLCENFGNESRGHRQYGHYSPGAYAEYVVHSVRSVTKIPECLPLEEAALLDPASIALHTVKRGMLSPGDTVVIIGPGPMGLMVELCARALGAGRVIVIGRGQRLGVAKQLGAEVIDFTQDEPVAAVREMTTGGPQIVIDCAGTPDTLAQAVEMVRKGGHISVIGIPPGNASLSIKRLVLDEIDLHGVRANQNTCEEVLPLMVNRRIDPRPLITHRFSLHDFAEAFTTFVSRRDGAIKVAIKP